MDCGGSHDDRYVRRRSRDVCCVDRQLSLDWQLLSFCAQTWPIVHGNLTLAYGAELFVLGARIGAVLRGFQWMTWHRRLQSERLVFDSLSELRLLARDSLRYRRQILGLKQSFSGRNSTVLLLDDRTFNYAILRVDTARFPG
jgi:hypothetical protein